MNMMPRENILYSKQWEAKQFLAKLLARENIKVVFSTRMQTACFDIKNRILYVPKWSDMSEELMDMMLGHEVAHALFTNEVEWKNIIKSLASYYRKKCPNATNAAQIGDGYTQILEDVRINRLIKIMFPGLRRDFNIGGRELLNRGFFTVRPGDTISTETHLIVDIICLLDKAGKLDLAYQITQEEQDLIDQVMQIETMDDVYLWGKKLIDYDLQKLQQNQQPQPQEGPGNPDSTNPESGDGDDDFSEESSVPSYEEVEEQDTSGDETEESEESGSEAKDVQSSETEEGEEDTSEGEGSDDTDTGESDDTGSGGTDGDEDETGEEEVSGDGETNLSNDDGEDGDQEGNLSEESSGELGAPKEIESYNDKLNSSAPSSANNGMYADIKYMPVYETRHMRNHVMDYKSFLAKCKDIEKGYASGDVDNARILYSEWKKVEFPFVKHMINQFNMKKAAKAWEKSSMSNRGDLNSNLLHSYKTRDDLFIRDRIMPKGKNHGFVILLDWSSSMDGILHPVVKQAISFAYFCRKLRIPFEVYNFNNGKLGYDHRIISKDEVTFESGHHLRCLLSSDMKAGEFDEACRILFSRTINSKLKYDLPTIMTPLCFSTFLMTKVVEEFKVRHNLDVTNYIAITDGGNTDHYKPDACTVIDPVTGLSYEKNTGSEMRILLSMLKNRNEVNTFNIFLNKGPGDYNGKLWNKTTGEATQGYDVRFDVSGEIHSLNYEEGVDNSRVFREKNMLLTQYIEMMSKNI